MTTRLSCGHSGEIKQPPVVAVVVAELPSASETFVERELRAVHQAGVRLLGIALRRPTEPSVQNPVTTPLPFPVHVNIAFSDALRAHLAALVTRPCAYLRVAAFALGRALVTPRAAGAILRGWGFLPVWASSCEQAGVTHVHAHFAFVTSDAAALLARWLRVPLSVSVHAWDLYAQPVRHIRRRLHRAVWIAVCTQQGREQVLRLLPRHAPKVVLVRHPAPTPFPSEPLPHRRPWVLAVGRFVPKKGFSVFIDACHLLLRQGVEFEARVLGDGPCRKELEQKIRVLGLQAVVTLEGWVPQSLVQQRMREATVLVVPSVVAPNGDRDGLPNVVLEALAAGTPVIATTASAAGEVIRHEQTGFLAPPHHPEMLAKYMAILLREPDLARRMGEAGRASLTPDFHGEHIGRTLRALFEGKMPPSLQPETNSAHGPSGPC